MPIIDDYELLLTKIANMVFKNLEYLRTGSEIQKLAYKEILDLKIMSILAEFQPVLTGTIPLDIAIASSDLDISCYVENHTEFKEKLIANFGNNDDFKLWKTSKFTELATVCSFKTRYFEIEIFGQNLPVNQQNAYRHMVIEHKILQEKDENFRTEIIKLKNQDLKTEPAFAKLLQLEGNPYQSLLDIENQLF
ncbi:DUF4269 domain-containing protein [Zunongwangia endophytica]|uniref:DUF4269 domain-containing protein n=1 Tax=Zunongwangia endophytica TaxID=1808945 RepID=A0ABV8HGU5_9FLAO|nr:DUF4269 domain-containing protein [Zunongwangia endophytica]MDN3593385.1 DUF4269 domain-containing protein [Zunongwangia endophytica]